MGQAIAMATGRTLAATIAVAGMAGLGLLASPLRADAQPELPPVDPEELVRSVLTANPGPFAGTVELDNELGLPALPDLPQAANGTNTARVWSDGDRRGRVQLPTPDGERTLVSDGETFWAWNSADRTVYRAPEGEHGEPEPGTADPGSAATELIDTLRTTSEIRVDGTAEVAARSAYELVLAPLPSERTLLREVRVAVDAEHRMPLQLTVLGTGSPDPALQLGFTDLAFGPQDPSLFTFTPPPGATVKDAPKPDERGAGGTEPTVVGDGWDRVMILRQPGPDAPEGERRLDLSGLGTPISGPWGNGRLITSAVTRVIVTDDGRVAIGAVPEQVLTEALAR
jgi:outer membrane lipoprotein-sorting protein